jgi:poly(3-hydroxybutyrate) depolymerase
MPSSPWRTGTPGTYSIALQSAGAERDFLLHLPPACMGGEPLPLVLMLHGAGAAGDRIEDLVRFAPIA